MTEDLPETDSAADPVHVAFVCVQNAGRSQMAHAFAKRELEERGVEDQIGLVTGGTDPAKQVHPEVIDVMAEFGIDLSDRTPRKITPSEIDDCDVAITMGCSADDVCPATWRGDGRDWDLEDPHGKDSERVRAIRDEIEASVGELFDELVADTEGEATAESGPND